MKVNLLELAGTMRRASQALRYTSSSFSFQFVNHKFTQFSPLHKQSKYTLFLCKHMSTTVAQGSWNDTNQSGAFVRKPSVFRNFITADGSSGFKAEANRYHLYISLACPWAHRTYIVRKLKGLEDVIGLSIVNWFLAERSWTFTEGKDEAGIDTSDPINHSAGIRDLYLAANPEYSGRTTVPVLWDKVQRTIVNNESAEIIRMLNSEFNHLAKNPTLDLYPEPLRKEIDEINEFVYPNINNGVYRCGFATTQAAYEEAFEALFSALDKIEERLSKSRYLVGNRFTEADVRLFTTLVRFDPVYVGHFKTNKKQIREYPAIYGYLKDLYQHEGIASTVNFHHIKHHYYGSHKSINPTGVVPKGPIIDLSTPHGREALGPK
eukprot:Phypoly_transcript_09637.p1 GENE.Phypoly_transcript_09637~~Phypoly_transcript_09637.p1  ORF type:complete len:378 (+),score=73.81 Phypoly_transcript_09637:235-1368(+)